MGKLDPSQQDRWWKSRIEKEELQYGIKGGTQDSVKSPRNNVTFLNTLGQPQVVALASEAHLSGAGALVSPNRGQTRPQSAAERPGSVASMSKAPVGMSGSVASQPRTSKKSQAGTDSQSSLMRRLEGLEEALSMERVARLQAEEEMRQLMALQHQRRTGK